VMVSPLPEPQKKDIRRQAIDRKKKKAEKKRGERKKKRDTLNPAQVGEGGEEAEGGKGGGGRMPRFLAGFQFFVKYGGKEEGKGGEERPEWGRFPGFFRLSVSALRGTKKKKR